MNPVLLSSAKHDYGTPRDLFERYNRIYRFTLDACATTDNAKCKRYFTREQDGLKQRWRGRVWCNPPYGAEIAKWVEKAVQSVNDGDARLVVMLLPARTDTRWFHAHCLQRGPEFLRGRITFDGAQGPAPFPSMVVVFK
jgi:site-specific DNA-methyltransferase (adenine-specific)